jgi:signal peptide peptidase SppA
MAMSAGQPGALSAMDTHALSLTSEARELLEQVWAIRPSAIQALWAAALDDVAHEKAAQGRASRDNANAGGGGASAVLHIRGPISKRPSFMSMFFGGTTTEELSAALAEAVADPAVSRIVLNVDSPGGGVDGVPELAAEIYAARAKKPITALVDTTAASAAYWLASQASEILLTPSASVGSIGVFALHVDQSRALEAAGLTPTFIQAGKYKTEGNPLQPLSDEAKATMQTRVDAFYGMFVRDVARGRGVSVDVVRSEVGEGRMVLAKDAVTRGMADNIRTASSPSSTRASVIDAGALLAVAHANATRIQRSLN